MNTSGARRASIILGVFMAIVLIGSALLPLLRQEAAGTTGQTITPTDVPIPTFPAPADPASISFDAKYLHPTGIFEIAQPTGFAVSEPNTQPSLAQVNMINNPAQSVIDAYVEQPSGPITLEELDSHFDETKLNASWARFTNWTESARRIEDDRLIIDFSVVLNRQSYVARQYAWTDGEWIYTVRVLTPDNATETLRYLLDGVSESLTPLKQFAGTPFSWSAYYDAASGHIIRYPEMWTVSDSAEGRIASITGPEGQALRVENRADAQVADEAAARAWVEAERAGATILSVEPVERGGAAGFSVAYAFTNADGEAQSGLAVLLNGADGALHAANLRFPGAQVDLNAVSSQVTAAAPQAEATAEPDAVEDPNAYLAGVMRTFTLIEPFTTVEAATTE